MLSAYSSVRRSGEESAMGKSLIRFAKPEEALLLSDLALRSKGYWGYDTDFLASCKQELTYQESQLTSPAYCFKVAELKGINITGFFALNFLSTTSSLSE